MQGQLLHPHCNAPAPKDQEPTATVLIKKAGEIIGLGKITARKDER